MQIAPVLRSIGQLVKNATLQSPIGSDKPPAHSIACELTFDENHYSYLKNNDRISWNQVNYWKTTSQVCCEERFNVECIPNAEWINAWSAFENN